MKYVELLIVPKLVVISNLRLRYVSIHNKNHNIEPKSKNGDRSLNIPIVNCQM